MFSDSSSESDTEDHKLLSRRDVDDDNESEENSEDSERLLFSVNFFK